MAVWDVIENSPGYAALLALLDCLFGNEAGRALRAPFVMGDTEALRALFEEAGVAGARIETLTGAARFPSLREWMHTDIRGWTLADRIDDAGFEQLMAGAQRDLARFVASDGTVSLGISAHIVTAEKR